MSEKSSAPVATREARPRRWDPFAGLAQLPAELDRFWGERWPFPGLRRFAELPGAWAPRADVFEQEGSVVVKAELPGVPKEQIAVTVEDGDLVIRGERKAEQEVKEEDYYRMERSYGSFYRRLPLPEGVKAEVIEATFKDGVLEVKIPKPAAAAAKPTKVAIN